MPLTPEDVSNKRFTPVRLREGYDMGEVDQFLDEVETELTRLTRENQDLRGKLSADGRGRMYATTNRTPAELPPFLHGAVFTLRNQTNAPGLDLVLEPLRL